MVLSYLLLCVGRMGFAGVFLFTFINFCFFGATALRFGRRYLGFNTGMNICCSSNFRDVRACYRFYGYY